jgi:hypothetical protein
MLFDALFFILGSVLSIVAAIAPTWIIWPQTFLDGVTYFSTAIAKLNFILPVDTFFSCVNFLAGFFAVYYSARLLISLINWARGAGEIKI